METVVATELEGSGLTAADFAKLPEGPPYYQLINGDLYMSPSPRRKHQKILIKLINRIGNYLEGNNIGEAYIAPSDVAINDDNVYNPDIYFVSNARRNQLTEQGCDGAPDLVVEVLSKSTARLDLGPKREVYAEAGVIEMWIISPSAQTIDIWRLQEDATKPAQKFTAKDSLASPLLPGLTIDLAEVFAD